MKYLHIGASSFRVLFCLLIALAAGGARAATGYSLVAWGNNDRGQSDVPMAARSGVVKVAAGFQHTLALRNDGSVMAWGNNDYGQTDVPLAAQSGVQAIAAGEFTSVALKSNGLVVAWGDNRFGQTTVPVEAQSGVTAIGAGALCTAAVKDQGVVVWGSGAATAVPSQVQAHNSVVGVAVGRLHIIAFKSNGQIFAWGSNQEQQLNAPIEAYNSCVSVSAGEYHTLLLRNDGVAVVWGGQFSASVPPDELQTGVAAIAAGNYHNLILWNDGRVFAWGGLGGGETDVPAWTETMVEGIAAGGSHSLALLRESPPILTVEPAHQTVRLEKSATLTVAAVGSYLNYQWRRNGTALSGATNAALSIASVQANQGGLYDAIVSNGFGSVTSAPAMLTVSLLVQSGFTNLNTILIPADERQEADPYPSVIPVSGISAPVAKVQVAVSFYHHTPRDVRMIVMSPSGRAVSLMSLVGGRSTAWQVITFDDDAASTLDCCESKFGVFRPSDPAFAGRLMPPGGVGTVGGTMASLLPGSPNGDWKLFVRDDYEEDGGYVGWWAVILEQGPRPLLQAGRVLGNFVLQWPVSSTGFKLQSATSLNPPVAWTDVANTPDVIGDQWTVTIPPSTGAQFFRLSTP